MTGGNHPKLSRFYALLAATANRQGTQSPCGPSHRREPCRWATRTRPACSERRLGRRSLSASSPSFPRRSSPKAQANRRQAPNPQMDRIYQRKKGRSNGFRGRKTETVHQLQAPSEKVSQASRVAFRWIIIKESWVFSKTPPTSLPGILAKMGIITQAVILTASSCQKPLKVEPWPFKTSKKLSIEWWVCTYMVWKWQWQHTLAYYHSIYLDRSLEFFPTAACYATSIKHSKSGVLCLVPASINKP